jgi:hypothetical protein
MAQEHWRYFIALEHDLEATTRFVEPAGDNFKTYSVEFARLFLATCSEIDVVCKVLCTQINPPSKPAKIDQYRPIILAKYPKFHTIEVHVPRYTAMIPPWRDWGAGKNPSWWKEHQLVKHKRHEHYSLANLMNCFAASAGLYALLLYLYRDELVAGRLEPRPQLFRLETQPSPWVSGQYELPDFPTGIG